MPSSLCHAWTVTSQPDSIVLAGGGATRVGGADKVLFPLAGDGITLLQGVINSCPGQVFVVGQERTSVSGATWINDDNPGGGPGAGIWSGLKYITTDYVFISAGDQLLNADDVMEICAAAIGHDGAWAIRSNGQGQPLCACVKVDVLRELLRDSQGVNASPLRLLSNRDMVGVSVRELKDIDTWTDVAQLMREEPAMDQTTQMWITRVATLLDVDYHDVPIAELLELTRDVAHGVERKSAPLTTFLVGYAAGKKSLSNEELIDLIQHISRAVDEWSASDN